MYTFSVMDTLPVNNPFNAPVYFKKTVTSTMDEARLLVTKKTGTVITADEQSAGRGRSGRRWEMNREENLSFTVILRYENFQAIPRCLTLRTGLAAALAIEDFVRRMTDLQWLPPAEEFCSGGKNNFYGRILVKWPNDIMLICRDGLGRKTAGILAEADGGTVYVGIGVNISRRIFPQELAGKACSIAQLLTEISGRNNEAAFSLAKRRFTLLEMILSRLYNELEVPDNTSGWRNRLEEKLYMKDRKVSFVPGLPEEINGTPPVSVIKGTLQGIGENGEICIAQDSGEILSFTTGELKVYG